MHAVLPHTSSPRHSIVKSNIRLTLLCTVSRKIFYKRVPNQVRWRVIKKTLKGLHSFLFVFLFTMVFHDVFEFTAAVQDFHVFRRIWKPTEGETLNCFYERGNVFDPFSIKVCQKDLEKTVGHLPSEISRITKFILDRNATVTVKLSSSHYRRSPLVQGGLEICCVVTVTTPSEFNQAILQRYRDLTKELYIEPTKRHSQRKDEYNPG